MRLTIIAVLLALCAIADARAADRFYVGEWQGEARYADSGLFTRCTIEGKYRSGITVDFALTRSYDLEIWLENPDWASLRKDRPYDVEYWIDRYPRQSGTFISLGSGFGRIDVAHASQVFDQLRGGVKLYVAGIGKVEIFRLDDTFVALGRLLECVNAALDAERERGTGNGMADRGKDGSSGRGPSGSGGGNDGWRAGPLFDQGQGRTFADRRDGGGVRPSPGDDSGNGKAGGRPSSAAEFMSLIFKGRDFAAFRILTGKDVPGPLRKEQTVWAAPDALGFTNRVVARSPTEAILERIKHDRDTCKNGEFDASGKAVTLSNGSTAYRYKTSCYDEQNYFARYSAYPARDGSWFLIGSLGVESPDGAREADETIFRFIAEALRG